MNLTFDTIYSELRNIYGNIKEPDESLNLQKYSHNRDDALFSHPLLYAGGNTFSAGQTIVIDSSLFPDDVVAGGDCLFIAAGNPPVSGAYQYVSVIVVPEADVTTLFNAVQGIFTRYDDWDSSLRELIFNDGTLEMFLAKSFDVIGNPLNIHNNNYNIIARYGEDLTGENVSVWRKTSFFDPDYLMKVASQVGDSVFYSDRVIYYRDEKTRQEFLFLNLFNGNTVAGRLVVMNDIRDFQPQDAFLTNHLGRYLETAFSNMLNSGLGKNLRRDSLIDFLSGKQHSDDKILHLKTISPLSRLGESQRLYCLVCSCIHCELSEQFIALQVERGIPGSVCVVLNERIVLVCSNMPDQSEEYMFENIRNILEKYRLFAGCSNQVEDFSDMRYCYNEAKFTLKQAESSDDAKTLNFFKDHAVDYIMKYGSSIIPVRLLCADCVLKLASHDTGAQVSYCDSLRVYLDCGRNMMETSRQLGIKRNTFLARLERIMRLVDLDLEDPENRLYIQISLRMIKDRSFSSVVQRI